MPAASLLFAAVHEGRDAGTLADVESAYAFRVRLLRDPGLRQRLATNARRLIEQRYDWMQIGQRFVSLVEDVASRPGRGGKWS